MARRRHEAYMATTCHDKDQIDEDPKALCNNELQTACALRATLTTGTLSHKISPTNTPTYGDNGLFMSKWARKWPWQQAARIKIAGNSVCYCMVTSPKQTG